MWTVEKLLNESDVEQKFVYPLLTLNPPYGFGYPTSTVQTKVNIKKYYIGKGAEKKTIFPRLYFIKLRDTIFSCRGEESF